MKNDTEKKYTYEEVIEALKSGEIRVPVPVLTGMNGSKYALLPSPYNASADDKWGYTEFALHNEKFIVPSLETKNEGMWFQGGPLLKGLHLVKSDSDIQGFFRSFYSYSRRYSPFNKGYKTIFINESALPLLGYTLDRKLIDSNRIEFLRELCDEHISLNQNFHNGIPYYNLSFPTDFNKIFGTNYAIPDFEITYKPFNDAEVYCKAKGDSMCPIISDGDVIALKEIEIKDIVYGEIYAIVMNNDSGIIRIIKHCSDSLKLRLSAINIYYKDIDIYKQTVIKVYKVLGSIKHFQ